ncbi:hypothetical protein [Acidianus ambivalens]|uniref:hypothetical protein n=1 Tax=Acidianus ambivalens TaxID=2283 RepID=UPI00128EA4EE|nr:hypothetical protein [Acidianus ambivalens]
MFEYYRRLDEINKDYEKNKEKYFREIAEIVRKYKGKAYIFGSQLKGNAIAGRRYFS